MLTGKSLNFGLQANIHNGVLCILENVNVLHYQLCLLEILVLYCIIPAGIIYYLCILHVSVSMPN